MTGFGLILMSLLLMPTPGPHRPLDPWPPPPEEGKHYPLWLTGYSWDIVGGDGCDSDCSVTASGVATGPELLGHVSACPTEEPNWLGATLEIIWSDGSSSFWWCIDAFGDPQNRSLVWIPGHGYHYRIDLALEDPSQAPYGPHYAYKVWWGITVVQNEIYGE